MSDLLAFVHGLGLLLKFFLSAVQEGLQLLAGRIVKDLPGSAHFLNDTLCHI